MNINHSLKKLEDEALALLLQGDDPVLSILRDQYFKASIKKRDITGSGVFTYFSIPQETMPIAGMPSFNFGNVKAEISNLKNGAGFLVFIKEGKLACLETYTYEEPWSEVIGDFEVSNITDKSVT